MLISGTVNHQWKFYIENLFYFLPLSFIYIMYSLLILFWATVIKSKIPRNWMHGKRMKIFFFTSTLSVFSLFFVISIISGLPTYRETNDSSKTLLVIINVIILLFILGLCISISVEGWRVRKLILELEVGSNKMENRITFLT